MRLSLEKIPSPAAFILPALLCAAGAARGENPPVFGPEPPAARADVDKVRAELQEALKRLEAQQQELAALRAGLDAAKAQSEAEAKRRAESEEKLKAAIPDRIAAFFRDNPAIRGIRNGLSLGGFIHADAVPWRQSSEDQLGPSGDLLNQTKFLIRRARLRLQADYGILTGAFELDGNTVNGPAARIIDAEATVQWPPSPGTGGEHIPYISATFGQFKIPFGFEVVQSDKDRLFLERATVIRALFPGEYDLGFRLAGGWRFIRYSLGVMNGHPVGERSYPGRDPDAGKDFLGRIGVDTPAGKWLHIAGGVSGLVGTGFSKGLPGTKDVIQWVDRNEDGIYQPGELIVVPGSPAIPSTTFSHTAFGGDLQLGVHIPVLGQLTVYGELVVATNLDRALFLADPTFIARDYREIGYYVAFTQELTKYGMIGVRYDYYNPDQDSTDRRSGNLVPNDASYWTLAVTGAVRLPPFGRLVLEYDLNRNHLGRNAGGMPVNLADDAFTLRAEVVF